MAVALPCDKGSEVAKFDTPQIKRLAQRLLLCPVSHPLTHQGLGWLTLQIYNFFLKQQQFRKKAGKDDACNFSVSPFVKGDEAVSFHFSSDFATLLPPLYYWILNKI